MQCSQILLNMKYRALEPVNISPVKKTNMAKLTTNKFGLAPYNNYIPVVMASKITTIKH